MVRNLNVWVVKYAMLGKEPSFGTSLFQGPKFHNETETVAFSILNLLFGKPGYFPSMPDLGIDIQQYLYSFWDELDVNVLKARIIHQCSYFREFIDDGSLDVIKSSYQSKPLLLITVPVILRDVKANLAIAVTQDENGAIRYNYQFIDSIS